MNNKITLISLICIIIYGCGRQNSDKDHDNMVFVSDSFTTVEVKNVSEEPYNVENIFDSVSFIRLSNEEEASIGAIEQVIMLDSMVLVRDAHSSKSVKLFSTTGKYLRNIGFQGRGPGEYIEPTFMQLIGDKIAVSDQYSQQILLYGLDGKFERAYKIPFFTMKFHIFNPDQFLFYAINSDSKEIKNYPVFETDSTFNLTKIGFYRENDSYESLLSIHNFFPVDDIVYFHPIYNDTIYSINQSGNVKVEYAIDFGKKTVPERLRRSPRRKELRQEQSESRYMFMKNNFYLTKDILHFSYTKAHRRFDCIYFKENKELVSFHERDGFFPCIFANIIGNTDDALIGYVYPGMINNPLTYWKERPYEEIVENFGKERADLILSLTLNDNPIITFYYPKKRIVD